MKTPEQLVLIPKAAEAIEKFNGLGLKTIIVTNQSGIARGFLTEETLSQIHDRMKLLLAQSGAHIDEILYCPHHPSGILPEFKSECDCRKPNPGMLKKAETKYELSLTDSFIIGDMDRDIETGLQMNMRTILVLTGKGKDTREVLLKNKRIPEYVAENLLDAAEYIEKNITK